jgi:hypothetical protein
MASGHSLKGLIKWLHRDEWRDRFAETFDAHLLPACELTGLEANEVVSALGEDWFTRTVWGIAFEDFLTRDFDDGSNIVDDYLKRRGWKESSSTRQYMAAPPSRRLNRHDWPFSMPSTAASPPIRQSAHKSGSKLGDWPDARAGLQAVGSVGATSARPSGQTVA